MNAIDVHIGLRLRLRRIVRGLSQKGVATLLDCEPRHLDDLEEGRSHITGAELIALSTVLGVPLAWFFDHPRPRSLTGIPGFRRVVDPGSAQVLTFPQRKASSGSGSA